MADPASQQANRSAMDPQRLVVIFYLFAGVIFALFLGHVLGMVWAQLGFSDPEVIEGLDWRRSTVLAVAIAAGCGVGAFLHPQSHRLSIEAASELMKVTWPSWSETKVAAVAVVAASLVSAVILFGIDTFAYKMMVDWLPLLWGRL